MRSSENTMLCWPEPQMVEYRSSRDIEIPRLQLGSTRTNVRARNPKGQGNGSQKSQIIEAVAGRRVENHHGEAISWLWKKKLVGDHLCQKRNNSFCISWCGRRAWTHGYTDFPALNAPKIPLPGHLDTRHVDTVMASQIKACTSPQV